MPPSFRPMRAFAPRAVPRRRASSAIVFSRFSSHRRSCSALALIFTPQVIEVLAPGFSREPHQFALAVSLTRITFPYLLLITLVTLWGGILNALHRFAVAAAAPILLNLTMMATLAGAAFFPGAGYAAAWGVLISGVLQAALVGGNTIYAGVVTFFRALRLDSDVRRFFTALIPATVGSAGTQLALFADTIIASFLSAGAISALYYADRIDQLPIGVIGIAVGTVLVPEMTTRLAAGDEAGARSAQNRAIEFALLLAIPCVVGFLVVPGLIMRALFMRGAFNAADAHAAAMTLMAYTIGLVPFVLIQRRRAVLCPRRHRHAGQGGADRDRRQCRLQGRPDARWLAQVGLALATSIGVRLDQFHSGADRRARVIAVDADVSFAAETCRRRRRARAGSVDRRPAGHGTVIVLVQVPRRIGAGAIGAAWGLGLWGTPAGVVWSALGSADETQRRGRRIRTDFICGADRGNRGRAGPRVGPGVMEREQETPCAWR